MSASMMTINIWAMRISFRVSERAPIARPKWWADSKLETERERGRELGIFYGRECHVIIT